MTIDNFIAVGVVGAALSFVVQVIKTKLNTSPLISKGLTIILAVAVGGIYFWIRSTVWWETILGILASATTVWAFFLREK